MKGIIGKLMRLLTARQRAEMTEDCNEPDFKFDSKGHPKSQGRMGFSGTISKNEDGEK